MKVLFKNRTSISKMKIIKTEMYAKRYSQNILYIVEISMCIFIILASLHLIMQGEREPIFYLPFAVWGIRETLLEITRKPIDGNIIYEFYDDYFQVTTKLQKLQIDYEVIEEIKEDNNNYYFIFDKCGLFLDKHKFIIGNEKELKQFIASKLQN